MPEIIACPQCSKQLSVPESLVGKAVKCPVCGNVFTVQPMEGAAPADPSQWFTDEPVRPPRGPEYEPPRRRSLLEEEDEDYPRWRDGGSWMSGDEQSAWQAVRSGMSLCIVGMWIMTGGIFTYLLVVLVLVAVGAAAGTGGSASAEAATVLGLGLLGCVTFLLLLGGGIVHLIGQGFGMGAPGGLKGLAVGSMVCTIVGIMVAFVGAVLTPEAVLFGMLLVFVSSVLWLLFLRGVAHELGAAGVGRSATLLLIATLVHVGLYILTIVLILAVGYVAVQALPGVGPVGGGSTTASAVSGLGHAVLGLWIVEMVLGLVIYIWYFVLLHGVRDAVRRALRR